MCTHNASVPAFMWPVIYFTSYFYDNLSNMHNKMPANENVQKKLANLKNKKKGSGFSATVDSYPGTNTHCNV